MRYRIFALAVLFALLFSHSVLAEQEADILSDSGILCLVNREKHLPKDYAPSDLVKPKVDTRKSSLQERIYMREEAAHALEDMFNAALTESRSSNCLPFPAIVLMARSKCFSIRRPLP